MKKEYGYLPERTLGKTGRDYSSKDKDLTIVMFPYESHSVFSKAIQAVYKILSIPFNLIVVEGNAPDEVRNQLEDCENRYGSMSVLYSTQYLSPGEIINLARPQIKTRYTFFMDNEICVRPGCVERMLLNAKNWNTDIVFPKYSLISRKFKTPQQDTASLETPGMRLTFLILTECLTKLKVDDRTDLYTAGWDLMLEFQSKGLRIMVSDEASVTSFREHAVKRNDRSLYRYQWNLERHRDVIGCFQNKWNLEVRDGLYQRWFEAKSKKAVTSSFLNWRSLPFTHTNCLKSKEEGSPDSLVDAALGSDPLMTRNQRGTAP